MAAPTTSGPAKLEVHVRSMEGNITKVQACETWTLLNFRDALRQWYEPDKSLTLLYKGVQLTDSDDAKTLSELEIEHESMVQLVVRSVGGYPVLI